MLNIDSIKNWREQDGIYYVSVISDNTVDWEKEAVGGNTAQLLRSKEFKPTNGVPYEVAIIRGDIFADEKRTVLNANIKATELHFSEPNPEIACLLCKKLAKDDLKEMGLRSIIVAHKPINCGGELESLLSVHQGNDMKNNCFLGSCYGNAECRFGDEDGFAYQVNK